VVCEVDGDFLGRSPSRTSTSTDRRPAGPARLGAAARRAGSRGIPHRCCSPGRRRRDRGRPRDDDERSYRSIAAFAIREDDRLRAVVYASFREAVDDLELDRTDARRDRARPRHLVRETAGLRVGALASELRYRELFEGSPDAVVVQSPDGRVVDANPAARRLYGEDLVGRSGAELVGGDDRQRRSTRRGSPT
jgi:PAS domain-containing protein